MEIDARGLACPQPVLMAKESLSKMDEGILTILVDNKGSSVNVKNFCESNGHTANVTEKDGVYQIDVTVGYDCAVDADYKSDKETVVLISGECVGSEEPELGKMLMKGFIGNLKNLENPPKSVIFVNNAVRLTTINEETVPLLRELDDSGMEILSCGICLEFYKLVDELKVGTVTDAHTVGNKLFNSDKVIRL
ncbi:MAG: sulfurtransferase-like selenium metabolism protein YedF [Denitrovibrio sp.]|nr:MAG: sulfurtransferase-like selenium metabolism protein YedF [Denitrovibrio sp.]